MWVVKIGGSLHDDALLPRWLELLAQRGAGRVAIVSGGGRFADAARAAQARWRFDDLAAHNLAVHAMAQGALLYRALQPALCAADSEAEIDRALRAGRTVVWAPLALLRDSPDELTSWDVSSDSLALRLALRMRAERAIIVKSCEIERSQSLERLAERGVLDRRFPALARAAAFPIELLHKEDLARAAEMLSA